MERFKHSTTAKVLFTGFISLVLLIPLEMVSGLIHERETRRSRAVQEVSGKWGHSQEIAGPFLVVPYKKYIKNDKGVIHTVIRNAFFLPDSLTIDGHIEPRKLNRGLYEVMLYKVKGLTMGGHFSKPDISGLRISAQDMLWNEAFLVVSIPDTRGIQKEVTMKWGGRNILFHPGTNQARIVTSGIHAKVGGPYLSGKGKIPFDITLNIQGSHNLSFVPAGKETFVKLSSTWKHPSFYGSILPESRKVTEEGFDALWKASYFGRNFPQKWTEESGPKEGDIFASAFGVTMYLPVDFYQKCVRAVKYGFLFISLTFLAFFLFEIFSGFQIHPVQYVMIGFALCLFYLLFISLSEHMNFTFSYLLSTLASTGLITGYSMKVLKAKQRGGIIAGLLIILYGYLYILLHNQDYTLLLGSLGLFIILTVVMYITRNVDWYNVQFKTGQAPEEA